MKQLSVFLINPESLNWFYTLLNSTSNASKSPLVSPLRSDSSELSYSSKNRMKIEKSRNLSESEAVLLFYLYAQNCLFVEIKAKKIIMVLIAE